MKNNFESAFSDLSNILKKEKFSKISKSAGRTVATESLLTRAGNLSFDSETLNLESASFHLDTIDDTNINENNVNELMAIYFGNRTYLHRGIGTHPDFEAISTAPEKMIFGYTTTLFIDIVGSTKLSYELKDPEKVFRIKNYILRYSIAIIQAFGGVVHRIMGDAVLAFFRSRDNEGDKEVDSAIDAINSASYIIKFMKTKVINGLKEVIDTEELGLRIGIEHGDKESVLWSSYGMNDTREITATSFYVDVAAKLQQATERNTILIGQNLKRKIGLDHSQTSHAIAGFLKFDETDKYRAFQLSTKYIDSLPIKSSVADNEIELKAYIRETQYYSFSKSIPIGDKIKFIATLKSQPNQNSLVFEFSRINNGTSSWFAKNKGETKTPIKIDAIEKESGVYTAEHSEEATYKGLHSMKVRVLKKVSYNKETALDFVPVAYLYVFVR
ncbi:adenylate/guanylate cyclase domain-containing protein [Pectobacterium odoriferum]|uniref:adenylate/guanylate cyclase domain-containing protein n=1 Tax=Pectobacterium TaxID=122277 RepID=UPI0032F04235